MEGQHYRFFVLLLVLSTFVIEIHGRKEAKALGHLRSSRLKGKAGVDKSGFDAANTDGNESSLQLLVHHSQKGLKEIDRIVRLPGQPHVSFSQYGGYVTVDRAAGRALYYYFVEAQFSSETLPLLLWLNGGPGCSSLAYGAMQELGPFRVLSDGKTLYRNKYSWNYAANVLFLESPAGVGFSYSNTTSDYDTRGDRTTAADNYAFLIHWLERFPEYKHRDFYISGESYAGHYVPQLAHTILYHNNKANRTLVNLKGIIIGNAVIHDETDEMGVYDFFAGHALISDVVANQIKTNCDFSPHATELSKKCEDAREEADSAIDYLDIYNIYAPLCSDHINLTTSTSIPKKASITEFDPCSEDYVYVYLNRPDVQEALHANVTQLTHDWEPCSDIIQKWNDSPSTIIPLLQEVLANGLRVWIFSGDVDGRVPFTSTLSSVQQMKLSVKNTWRPWFFNGEVGGSTQEYEGGLTFATVRDAGHQVPSYQPARALSLIKHFLDGTSLPITKR